MIENGLLLAKFEDSKIVRANYELTMAGHGGLSVYAERILMYVAWRIKEGEVSSHIYTFTVNDIAEVTNVSIENLYKEYKQAIEELSSIVFMMENKDEKHFYPLQLINTEKQHDGTKTEYRNGAITLVFNREMHSIITNLSQYCRYDLIYASSLNSNYAMRLYQLFESFRNERESLTYSVDWYRRFIGCDYERKNGKIVLKKGKPVMKYSNVSDLIKFTTIQAQETFKGTRNEFIVEGISEKVGGKGRKPITHIKFTFTNRNQEAVEILDYQTEIENSISKFVALNPKEKPALYKELKYMTETLALSFKTIYHSWAVIRSYKGGKKGFYEWLTMLNDIASKKTNRQAYIAQAFRNEFRAAKLSTVNPTE